MTKHARARALLVELEAVANPLETDMTVLLTLVNEALRDAKALAQDVLAEDDTDKAA